MGIFDSALPAGWTALNDEQKARAAALALGARHATGGLEVDPVAGAIFVLDGVEGYTMHMSFMNRGILHLPEVRTMSGEVIGFDFGGQD